MKAAYIPANQADGFAAIGETISYEVKSTNDGNVDVTGVTITDSLGG